MIPTKLPWGARRKEPEPEPELRQAPSADTTPSFLGLRNETQRSVGPRYITVEVRGLKAVPSGSYKVDYHEGTPLRIYLRKLKLQHAATYAAVYDRAALEHGRCRMSYIPGPEAQILLCHPDLSSALRMQRTLVDAEDLAYRMGPNIVERKIR